MLVEKIIRLNSPTQKQINDVTKFLDKKKIEYDTFETSYNSWVDYAARASLNNSLDGSKKIKLREKTVEDFVNKNVKELYNKIMYESDIIDYELIDDIVNEFLVEKNYINNEVQPEQSDQLFVLNNDTESSDVILEDTSNLFGF